MRYIVNKQPQLLTLCLTVLITAVVIVKQGFIAQTQLIDGSFGVLSQQLYQLLQGIFPTLDKFSVILYVIGGVVLTKLSIRRMIYSEKSLLTLLFYLIFSTSFFNAQTNFIEALTALLIILSVNQLIKSYSGGGFRGFNYLFSAGVLMGITPLLIPQAILVFPLIIFACVLFKRSLNELIVSICGYLFPVLLYSYILWAVDTPFMTVFNNISGSLSDWSGRYFVDYMAVCVDSGWIITLFAATILISITALISYNITSREHKQSPSGYVFILFSYLGLFAAPALFIAPNNGVLAPVLSIALSVLCTSFFVGSGSKFKLMLYIAIILFSLLLF